MKRHVGGLLKKAALTKKHVNDFAHTNMILKSHKIVNINQGDKWN